MPELNNPPLYNPVPVGNWPHSFTGCYVPVLLKKLHTWRWQDLTQKSCC